MRYTYEQRLERGSLTLDELDDLVESIREYAFPELVEETHGRIIAVRVIIEADDGWDLRELVEQTRENMEGWQHGLKQPILPDDKALVT